MQFPQKLYGLPQIHKVGTLLRPIMSSRGSITYVVAKKLTNITHPLFGQSPHHFKNTQHFMQHIQKVKLKPGEIITSYDIKTLLTSAPVDPSISIVKHKLHQDPTLPQRTNMSIQQIVTLLEFCLKNTYFLYQGKSYDQVHGAAMGSLISSLIANLSMEDFKVMALSTAPHLWLRYMDDTLVIQEAKYSQQQLVHINSQDPHIQLTMEEPDQEGALPFLDTLVSSGPNNTLTTSVYRKPTHRGHYFHQWTSAPQANGAHKESQTGLQFPTMGSEQST